MAFFQNNITKVEDLSKSKSINTHFIVNNNLLIGPNDTSWICAIICDDHVAVSSILNTVNGYEKHRLINGIFENADIEDIPKKKTGHGNIHVFTVCNPWSLAVSFSSVQVMEVFLSHGADIFQVDNGGNNALHKLVEFAFMNLDEEEKLTDTYDFLIHRLGPECIVRLLMMENKNQLRPLELAAHLGTFTLFQAILETGNVYLVKEEICGVKKLQYFDVTEYEAFRPNTRRSQSPVNLLMCLDRCTISEKNREKTKKAFDSQPLCAWLDANFRANKLYIFIWAFTRIAFSVLFYLTDFQPVIVSHLKNNLTFSNASLTSCSGSFFSPDEHFIFMMILSIASMVMVIYDVRDIVKHIIQWKQGVENRLLKTPRGDKSIILHYQFYRGIHFVTCICIFVLLMWVWMYILGFNYINLDAGFLLISVASVGSVWGSLYFIQILPSVGYFVISIERMIRDLVQFICVFVIFHFSFTYAFIKLLDVSARTGECPVHFSSMTESFYGTFMIMLNMINLRKYNSADNTSLYTLHVLYVFMAAILLINFLVATFSSSYSEVSLNKHVISRIQALSLATVVENRIPTFMWPLSRWMQKRYFVVEDDKLYITRLVPIK